MKWLKLHHEVRNDGKLRLLTGDQHRVFIHLLLYASEQPRRGIIDGKTDEVLAAEIALGDMTLLRESIATLEKYGIIRITDATALQRAANVASVACRCITVANFDKRQESGAECNALTSTERSRKYREQLRLERDAALQRDATRRNGDATTDRELEKENSRSTRDDESRPKPAAAAGKPKAQEPDPKDDPSYAEAIAVVRVAMGNEHATNIGSARRSIDKKIGGRWECLMAAARKVGRDMESPGGRTIDRPVGLVISLAEGYSKTPGPPPELPIRVHRPYSDNSPAPPTNILRGNTYEQRLKAHNAALAAEAAKVAEDEADGRITKGAIA